MEKYGFVYIWYDRKHKRYYIGCHWGTEDDGYICSSPWMLKGYKHRPQDFKRRILKNDILDRKSMLEEEYRWLSMIKDHELKRRYYNLHNHHFKHWSASDNVLSVKEKIKASYTPERRKQISERMKGNTHGAVPCSEEKSRKLSSSIKKTWYQTHTQEMFDAHSKKMKGRPAHNKGKKQPKSEQHLIEQRLRNDIVFGKEWIVEDTNGYKYTVRNLNKWCVDQGLTKKNAQALRYFKRKEKDNFVMGYRLV